MEIAVSTGLYGILLSPRRGSAQKETTVCARDINGRVPPSPFIVNGNVDQTLRPWKVFDVAASRDSVGPLFSLAANFRRGTICPPFRLSRCPPR